MEKLVELRTKVKKWIERLLYLLYIVALSILTWFFLQIFCFTTFNIPSDSMEPGMISGDRIVVNKLIYGARIFNINRALNREKFNIYRMPGLGSIKRNDIVVFNFPYPERHDSINFDIMQYYVKRCVAVPGDTFEIKDAHYHVKGIKKQLGNVKFQDLLASAFKEGTHEELYRIVFKGYPHDTIVDWNMKDFGPLYIPRKGDKISMNRLNWALYRELIEWEQGVKLRFKDGKFYLGDKLINEYQFISNYYFVTGDKVMNSKDSRYWGMLPEEYIVGKATRIWYSEDRYTGEIRWKRVMKSIK